MEQVRFTYNQHIVKVLTINYSHNKARATVSTAGHMLRAP